MVNFLINHMTRNARKRPLCTLRITKALISLRICAVWSGPALSAYRTSTYCSTCRWTENVQTRVHGCARLSAHSLFAYGIRAFFLRCISNCIVEEWNQRAYKLFGGLHYQKWCNKGFQSPGGGIRWPLNVSTHIMKYATALHLVWLKPFSLLGFCTRLLHHWIWTCQFWQIEASAKTKWEK